MMMKINESVEFLSWKEKWNWTKIDGFFRFIFHPWNNISTERENKLWVVTKHCAPSGAMPHSTRHVYLSLYTTCLWTELLFCHNASNKVGIQFDFIFLSTFRPISFSQGRGPLKKQARLQNIGNFFFRTFNKNCFFSSFIIYPVLYNTWNE